MYVIAMIHRNVLENMIDSLHYLNMGQNKEIKQCWDYLYTF